MAAGQSPLSCWTQAAGAQELLRPGSSALAARHYNLGQESQANGPILLIQPRGRHTAALSLTARREDKSERGGEGSSRGAFGLDRPQRALFFTPERESSWTSSSICGRVWTGAITQSPSPGSPLARVAPLEAPIRRAMRSGSFKSTKRHRGLCLFPSEDVCQRSPDLYPHTVSFAHFLNIFPFRQTGHTSGAHVIWQWRQVTKPDTRRIFQKKPRSSRGIICPSVTIVSLWSQTEANVADHHTANGRINNKYK